MTRFRLLTHAALLAIAPATLLSQAGTIAGVVVSATGQPLAYGIVSVDGAQRSMFTNDSGGFAFRDLQPGRYTVRAKRLGFAPAAVSIAVRPGAVDTVRFALERIAVRLDSVVVSSHPACTAPGIPMAIDTALAAIVAQLQLNAEQLRFMSEAYPFEYYLQILKARTLNSGELLSEDPRTTRYTSKTRPSYRKGEVLRLVDGEYHFQIPELQDIASPEFLSSHCWHYAGIDTVGGRPHFRVDVVAAEALPGVDIDGSFFIDAQSFLIRRSVVRLSRRPDRPRAVMQMETTTYYQEILPSVPIIAHVDIVQTMDPRTRPQYRESREAQHALSYRFLGPVPEGAPPSVRSP